MRLLLIEDDIAAADYLRQGLAEAGHTVDAAHDGETGLHLALAGAYDVLVIDRMLPRRDGLAIVRMRLRAKIDRDFAPPLLHTLRGIGYRLGDET